MTTRIPSLSDEKVTAVQALPEKDDVAEYLVMATRNGLIKKTSRTDFENIRRSGLKAITLKDNDALEWVAPSSGKDVVMLVTSKGQAVQFSEKDVRPMGRTASGVRGITLKKADSVVGMHVIPNGAMRGQEVLIVTEEGYGKRTNLSEYRVQKRGGSGIKTANVTAKTGPIVTSSVLTTNTIKDTDVLIISEKGQVIRMPANSITKQGRATQGVRLMRASNKSGKVATFTTWGEAGEEE